jgi:hypothetical protein
MFYTEAVDDIDGISDQNQKSNCTLNADTSPGTSGTSIGRGVGIYAVCIQLEIGKPPDPVSMLLSTGTCSSIRVDH